MSCSMPSTLDNPPICQQAPWIPFALRSMFDDMRVSFGPHRVLGLVRLSRLQRKIEQLDFV